MSPNRVRGTTSSGEVTEKGGVLLFSFPALLTRCAHHASRTYYIYIIGIRIVYHIFFLLPVVVAWSFVVVGGRGVPVCQSDLISTRGVMTRPHAVPDHASRPGISRPRDSSSPAGPSDTHESRSVGFEISSILCQLASGISILHVYSMCVQGRWTCFVGKGEMEGLVETPKQ